MEGWLWLSSGRKEAFLATLEGHSGWPFWIRAGDSRLIFQSMPAINVSQGSDSSLGILSCLCM